MRTDTHAHKTHDFPRDYEARIESLLHSFSLSLRDSKKIATSVLKLSDFYLTHPDKETPWHETWTKVAYLAYFFPLNYLRASGVLKEGERVGFFSGLHSFSDFGSGPGVVPLVLNDQNIGQMKHGLAIERSSACSKLYLGLTGEQKINLKWNSVHDGETKDCNFFSFSLTELPKIPRWALQSEALVIIEPATSQDSRRLMAWRHELQEDGYKIWAPCTHQGQCPLLMESKRDWCHDRIYWNPPEWFQAIEDHLPIKNKTLTYSYLLARRKSPELAANGRLIGDLMREKGQSRQMVCRGHGREFLSWQKRDGEAPHFPRGALVKLAQDVQTKGRDVRPKPDEVTLVIR